VPTRTVRGGIDETDRARTALLRGWIAGACNREVDCAGFLFDEGYQDARSCGVDFTRAEYCAQHCIFGVFLQAGAERWTCAGNSACVLLRLLCALHHFPPALWGFGNGGDFALVRKDLAKCGDHGSGVLAWREVHRIHNALAIPHAIACVCRIDCRSDAALSRTGLGFPVP